MEHIFVASRTTSGNLLFRDKIIINTTKQTVSFFKRNLLGIGYEIITVRFRDISSVRVISRNEWLYFCSFIIETIGGQILHGNGFSEKDVLHIKTLIRIM